jgi:xanthine dehydrogenase molybdopterin-binding subunit B
MSGMTTSPLRPDRIVATIELLGQRIEERFPDTGLRNVCEDVLAIAKNMETRTAWIGRPVIWLRITTWLVVVAVIAIVVGPIVWVVMNSNDSNPLVVDGLAEVIQLTEAGINDVVLIGAAIFFVLTLETRYKRQRALQALHEIRSIAHVIDMHQLTKDPHRILGNETYKQTTLSPKLEMSRFELHRYLDYCSEMLALLGKIAAVYVQEFDDGVALASAAEIETLTTGLSRKIWQKIAILATVEQDADDAPRSMSNENGNLNTTGNEIANTNTNADVAPGSPIKPKEPPKI